MNSHGINNVSSATIRRDLTILENEGLIKRIHGGAKLKVSSDPISQQDELTMVRKYDLHSIEKQRIASYVTSLVKDGDCIFIDSGSTPAYIYPYIAHKQVMVVTNNTMVLHKIKPLDKAKVIIGAKEYNVQFRLIEGPLFMNTLTHFNYDCVFIGVNGIVTFAYTKEFDAILTTGVTNPQNVNNIINCKIFIVCIYYLYYNWKEN